MVDDASLSTVEADLVDLARLSALGSADDVRLFLTRLIRKYRSERPDLSRKLDDTLKTMRKTKGMTGVLRRGPTSK